MKKDFNKNLVDFIKLGAFFVVIILSFYFINFGYLGLSDDQEVWAQFGDYLGGVLNPIFAFLAFIALLITIKLQNEALQTSKTELELTRKELAKSAKAQEEQSKSLELQNKATELQIFENTFFQLINLYIDTKRSLIINLEKNDYFEKIGFGSMDYDKYPYYKVNSVEEKIHNFSYQCKTYIGNEVFKIYKEVLSKTYDNYNAFNKNYESHTGSYFGQIYQVLKFISKIKIKNKQEYVNIFRAQFTKDELEFLFYHCLGKIGKKRFKLLVEEYEFFEHITHIEKKDAISKPLSEYKISAYGKNESLRKMHIDYKNKEKDKYWNENLD